MRCKNILLLIIFLITTCEYTFAFNKTIEKDSTKYYRKLETYSNRHKFTKFIHSLIFTPLPRKISKSKKTKKTKSKPIQKSYKHFEGKIIREIIIETHDPFVYAIDDTIINYQNIIYKTGNKLHVKSHKHTIKNLLLFKKNQVFDSLVVLESERLVRRRGFVHEVIFTVRNVSKNSDSVDIFIRELDNWSIIPLIDATTTSVLFKLKDDNFLGFGHESKNDFSWNHVNGEYNYNINYNLPNIRNTYINTSLHYQADELKNTSKSITINRPFYSSLAKEAAGISISQLFRKDIFLTKDSTLTFQNTRINTQDFWLGYATQLFKGNNEINRTTNLILTTRYLRIRYPEKPSNLIDTLQMFPNEDFYLVNVGVSTRKYIQDKYIFKYGVVEDVPIGRVLCLTAGYNIKNNIGRMYFGVRAAYGDYYDWGLLTSYVEYGSFFHNSSGQQGVFIAGLNYFTKLLEIGSWKFRQFAKPELAIGIKRFSYENITLNDGNGIDGFNSLIIEGKSRLQFKWQMQSYSPWNLMGFRFGPFIACSAGMLFNTTTNSDYSNIYTQIGLGVLIKNERLITSNFQFSFSFYPTIPGLGNNIFKTNKFKTTDFDFRNYEITAPSNIEYH